jgi:hypothetical protein
MWSSRATCDIDELSFEKYFVSGYNAKNVASATDLAFLSLDRNENIISDLHGLSANIISPRGYFKMTLRTLPYS